MNAHQLLPSLPQDSEWLVFFCLKKVEGLHSNTRFIWKNFWPRSPSKLTARNGSRPATLPRPPNPKIIYTRAETAYVDHLTTKSRITFLCTIFGRRFFPFQVLSYQNSFSMFQIGPQPLGSEAISTRMHVIILPFPANAVY